MNTRKVIFIGASGVSGILSALLISGALGGASATATQSPVHKKNAAGQSYGSALGVASANEPDLVAVYGDSGAQGYAKREDLKVQLPKNPAEAISQQNAGAQKRVVPVYDASGKPTGDTFTMNGEAAIRVAQR